MKLWKLDRGDETHDEDFKFRDGLIELMRLWMYVFYNNQRAMVHDRIVGFLHQEFRAGREVVVPHRQLITSLLEYKTRNTSGVIPGWNAACVFLRDVSGNYALVSPCFALAYMMQKIEEDEYTHVQLRDHIRAFVEKHVNAINRAFRDDDSFAAKPPSDAKQRDPIWQHVSRTRSVQSKLARILAFRDLVPAAAGAQKTASTAPAASASAQKTASAASSAASAASSAAAGAQKTASAASSAAAGAQKTASAASSAASAASAASAGAQKTASAAPLTIQRKPGDVTAQHKERTWQRPTVVEDIPAAQGASKSA
jgi:hypothetical protein